MKTNIRDFVEYLLQSLCEHPDQIQVIESVDEKGNLLTITVAEADMGRVIGKSGKNITALRTLVNVMGARNGERTSLKVNEES